MEILIILTVGIIAIFNIAAYALFDKRIKKYVRKSQIEVEHYIEENRNTVIEIVTDQSARIRKENVEQAAKTRKETQEIKTRLTQVRKDLNVIGPKIAGNVFKSVIKLANSKGKNGK